VFQREREKWGDVAVAVCGPLAALDAQPSRASSLDTYGWTEMSLESQNCQNEILNRVRKERQKVAVYLVNGIKLVGHVESFDQYMVILSSASGMQAVYKHGISTIQEEKGKPRETTGTRTSSAVSRDVGGEQTVAISYKRRAATDTRE
jgi:host factor-I protein